MWENYKSQKTQKPQPNSSFLPSQPNNKIAVFCSAAAINQIEPIIIGNTGLISPFIGFISSMSELMSSSSIHFYACDKLWIFVNMIDIIHSSIIFKLSHLMYINYRWYIGIKQHQSTPSSFKMKMRA